MAEENKNEVPEEQPQSTEQTEKNEQTQKTEQTQQPKASPSGEQQRPAAQPEPQTKETNKDARMWAMFSHLAGLAVFLPIPLANIIGPLIVWQIKKDDFTFVNEQGKEAVNFQISMAIYGIIAGILIFAGIGILLLPAVIIVDIVFLLIAAVKANDGFHYRYPLSIPLSIRFIK